MQPRGHAHQCDLVLSTPDKARRTIGGYMATILVVEDEESLQYYLKNELIFEGYSVVQAFDGEEGLAYLDSSPVDAVLLDWMLPKKSGVAVLRRLRQTNQTLPVILMTAKSELDDKVVGLDTGADDYLTKPFEIEELLARLRVVLRRQQAPVPTSYQLEDLTLNTTTHRVQRGEKIIALTQREFDLLTFLMQHQDQVVSRDEILDHVWGIDFAGQYNTVDVNVRHLRQKIDVHQPSLIQTARGVGYVLRKAD